AVGRRPRGARLRYAPVPGDLQHPAVSQPHLGTVGARQYAPCLSIHGGAHRPGGRPGVRGPRQAGGGTGTVVVSHPHARAVAGGRATYPPKYCPMRASLSPACRGLSRVWARSSTASFTSTSMCSARSPVSGSQSALCNCGKRPLRRRRTLRTVSPSLRGSGYTLRVLPSPPTNLVIQATTSISTWPAAVA